MAATLAAGPFFKFVGGTGAVPDNSVAARFLSSAMRFFSSDLDEVLVKPAEQSGMLVQYFHHQNKHTEGTTYRL